ncbi:TAPETUM 1 [Artemisia annua]|uniref:TAPETUM 1 n=1 Tax=Artemisia annua TaxID=35608 RepID=A0A2U1MMA1_ARTAN|nr:TAPETUM 1 [Artemisia annua]
MDDEYIIKHNTSPTFFLIKLISSMLYKGPTMELCDHTHDVSQKLGTKRLTGKVAIVTGGARGIGGATAILMAENGAHVIVADVLDEVGANLANSIKGLYIHCDVSKESDVESAVQLALSWKGKLDILFNNAGILGYLFQVSTHMNDIQLKQTCFYANGLEFVTSSLYTKVSGSLCDSILLILLDSGRSITNLEMKKLSTLINVNINGVIHGIKHAARAMISVGNKGSIICSSSSAAIMGGLASHSYTLTKGAILGISRSAACELGVHGIRVNCVSPHGIPSEMLMKAYREHLGKSDMTIEEVSNIISEEGSLLHGKCGSFEDVAQAVLFLASDESGFITGHNLVVDGGYTSASVLMSFIYRDKMI